MTIDRNVSLLLILSLSACSQTETQEESPKEILIANELQEKISSLKQSAERGDADAQNRLGELYHFADNGKQNYQEAMSWYLRAANQCHATAANHIGRLYLNGEGVKKDSKEAARWYLRAAERGDYDGQVNVAHAYAGGLGTEVDYERAYFWYGIALKNPAIVNEGKEGKLGNALRKKQKEVARKISQTKIKMIDQMIENWSPVACLQSFA